MRTDDWLMIEIALKLLRLEDVLGVGDRLAPARGTSLAASTRAPETASTWPFWRAATRTRHGQQPPVRRVQRGEPGTRRAADR